MSHLSAALQLAHGVLRPLRPGWFSLVAGLSLLIVLPLSVVLGAIWLPAGEGWMQLVTYLLPEYLRNTLWLLLATLVLSATLGLTSAWLTTRYTFPGSRWLKWASVLPLSLPTYLVAITYGNFLSFTGPVYTGIAQLTSLETARALYTSPLQPGMLAVLMALVLYPYIFLACRLVFLRQGNTYFEAARSLGTPERQLFWRLALPLARPALAGGGFLVGMEVLNDYGAAKYFGINTLTTGIFRSWFSLGDLPSAVKLSGLLLAVVIILLALERWQRGRRQFNNPAVERVTQAVPLRGWQALFASLAVFLPVFLGFIVPTAYNVWLAAPYLSNWSMWLIPAGNSLLIALLAALLVVCISMILVFGVRITPGRVQQVLARVSTTGYAVPGAIIAVGLLLVSTTVEGWVSTASGLWLTGSWGFLVYAYVIRFLAVGYNPVDAGFRKHCRTLDESALALGRGPWNILTRINLPVMRPVWLTAWLLVFVDVLKELPLTLILRPFNFETLATRAFEYANNEMPGESALASLCIVAMGILPVILSVRMMDTRPADVNR